MNGDNWAPEGYKESEINRTSNRRTRDDHMIYLASVNRALDDTRGPPGLYLLLVVDNKVFKEYQLKDLQESGLLKIDFRRMTKPGRSASLEGVITELDKQILFWRREEQK